MLILGRLNTYVMTVVLMSRADKQSESENRAKGRQSIDDNTQIAYNLI